MTVISDKGKYDVKLEVARERVAVKLTTVSGE